VSKASVTTSFGVANVKWKQIDGLPRLETFSGNEQTKVEYHTRDVGEWGASDVAAARARSQRALLRNPGTPLVLLLILDSDRQFTKNQYKNEIH
jgi:hypothetical protein